MFCDKTNNKNNIKDFACLTKNAPAVDDNSNTLIGNSNNMMSDSLLAVNATLNIGTNVISEIEEGTYILSSNNCDNEQCNINQKSDCNLTLCDQTCDKDNIKDSACLAEDAFPVDDNFITLVVDSSNNMMNDSLLAVNDTLNIGINVISEIEEGTYILSSNNCDNQQCDTNQKSDLTLCDKINEDNIKDSAYLTEDAFLIDNNFNTLVVGSSNNMMRESLINNASICFTTTSNVNHDVENVSKISYKPSHITQGAKYCDKFNSIVTSEYFSVSGRRG
ncbi:putative uncharacterized protein DDB_G0282133 [Monomorium pharaonis]|uniref:putative uncharacterized protein DDB_G0282133 n=1 Tax=Monomorium pharaonis TaxID=307658 RepID=UPI0017474232|nr:putative uncharacterized protein DDB_G0282133 [Monomorium pharaonis]